MDPLLRQIETSAFSTWLRESTSVWVYPTMLSAHALGMGLAVGVTLALALAHLGIVRLVPARELRQLAPAFWAGFVVNAVSGVLLLVAYPTKALSNPMFYVKLVAVAGGVRLFQRLDRRLGEIAATPATPAALTGRLLAAAALFTWAVAIVTGRLLAYTYHRLFVDF